MDTSGAHRIDDALNNRLGRGPGTPDATASTVSSSPSCRTRVSTILIVALPRKRDSEWPRSSQLGRAPRSPQQTTRAPPTNLGGSRRPNLEHPEAQLGSAADRVRGARTPRGIADTTRHRGRHPPGRERVCKFDRQIPANYARNQRARHAQAPTRRHASASTRMTCMSTDTRACIGTAPYDVHEHRHVRTCIRAGSTHRKSRTTGHRAHARTSVRRTSRKPGVSTCAKSCARRLSRETGVPR